MTTYRRKSAAPDKFRTVIDNHHGGKKQISAEHNSIAVALFDAELSIAGPEVGMDATVTIESSFTDEYGDVMWHLQRVMKHPATAEFKQYCATHKFCESCGQVIPVTQDTTTAGVEHAE